MTGQEEEGLAVMKRDWVAISATVIKASAAASDSLPEDEKRVVAKGAQVSATIESEDAGHWTIADALLEGEPLPENMRFIFKGGWQLLDQVEPAIEVPEFQEPVAEPEMDAHDVPAASIPPSAKPVVDFIMEPTPSKPANERRLFALFRRGAKTEKR